MPPEAHPNEKEQGTSSSDGAHDASVDAVDHDAAISAHGHHWRKGLVLLLLLVLVGGGGFLEWRYQCGSRTLAWLEAQGVMDMAGGGRPGLPDMATPSPVFTMDVPAINPDEMEKGGDISGLSSEVRRLREEVGALRDMKSNGRTDEEAIRALESRIVVLGNRLGALEKMMASASEGEVRVSPSLVMDRALLALLPILDQLSDATEMGDSGASPELLLAGWLKRYDGIEHPVVGAVVQLEEIATPLPMSAHALEVNGLRLLRVAGQARAAQPEASQDTAQEASSLLPEWASSLVSVREVGEAVPSASTAVRPERVRAPVSPLEQMLRLRDWKNLLPKWERLWSGELNDHTGAQEAMAWQAQVKRHMKLRDAIAETRRVMAEEG